MENLHPCESICLAAGTTLVYGNVSGICRITGKQSTGLLFDKWVRDTFTDHAYLKHGNIISNEALFCFDEQSELLMHKTGRDKAQRFRTYSHLIDASGAWHAVTKADKQLIYRLIVEGAPLVCLTDSGQKHVLFKHRSGFWQLDDLFVMPDVPRFAQLHDDMCALLPMGFSQAEIISGHYLQYRIMKAGFANWLSAEQKIKAQRGTQFFKFTSWLLFNKSQNE